MEIFNSFYVGIPYGFMVGFIVYMIAYAVHTVLRVFDSGEV